MRRLTDYVSAKSSSQRRPSGCCPNFRSARPRVHASPRRKADGRHNERLSTSWPDVISHSPREIPFFGGTVLVRRTTAQRSLLCSKTLLSLAYGGKPPWSLAVSLAAHPDRNYRTGSPQDST